MAEAAAARPLNVLEHFTISPPPATVRTTAIPETAQPFSVIEHLSVSPPPGTVPTTSIPLSFMDIPWNLSPPIKRLVFYEFPHPTHYFVDNILPTLTSSLSLVLQHFFPLAGNIICPPAPQKPYILFQEGRSAVPFTVAESAEDFNQVISDQPKDARILHPFVPNLPPACLASDGTRTMPLLALQMVLFPNVGICVALHSSHQVADGISFDRFMKSWITVFRAGGDITCLDKSSLPSHDRAAIEDPSDLLSSYLNLWSHCAPYWNWNMKAPSLLTDKFRTTLAIDQHHIERLKHWVSKHYTQNSTELHLSTFVVTCALMWVSLTKARANGSSDLYDPDEVYRLGIPADCRRHLKGKLSTTYFGNCLAIGYVSAKKGVLLGDNGIAIAAEAIRKKTKELESGAFVGAEKWMSTFDEAPRSQERLDAGVLTVVVGSPRFHIYNADWGWGKPKKIEAVQIDVSGSICLSERRNGEGGVEIGFALSRREMEAFYTIFEQQMKQILD